MAAGQGIYGVSGTQDLNPSLIQRDSRPVLQVFKDALGRMGGQLMMAVGCVIWAASYFEHGTALVEVGFLAGLLILLRVRKFRRNFPFQVPAYVATKRKAEGVFYLGSDRVDESAAWFSDSDMRTHMLVFGSTGSGKTIFLMGLYYQSLLVGSGVLYVDGKADNTVFWMAFAIARRLGREDDFLVVNYLTSGLAQRGTEDLMDRDKKERRSNTTNPLAEAGPEQARSLIVSLMRESGGEGDMWKGRASVMLGTLMRALCVMRDREEIILDVNKVREYMPLDKMVDLAFREDLPDAVTDVLKAFLQDLPGFNLKQVQQARAKKPPAGRPGAPPSKQPTIPAKAYEQHGYLVMQLTEPMSDLVDTYGHIFAVSCSEVDFRDVVFNRRILFVMLPSLEADPDRLAGLGKLIVAGVRSALAPALGSSVEGGRREVIEQKPTNAKVPFLMIFDEYGYYSVSGFAVVAAQARSLGVSVVFAGQDYPSFQKNDEKEAKSTIANTNIKIAMKLEDPEDTFAVIEKRGGEAQTTRAEKSERRMVGRTFKQDGVLEKRKRIDLRDLVNQTPGQAHVIWQDSIARLNLCYVKPEKYGEALQKARLNQFLPVPRPTKDLKERTRREHSGVEMFLVSGRADESPHAAFMDDKVRALVQDYRKGVVDGMPETEASRFAVGLMHVRNEAIDGDRRSQASGLGDYDDDPDMLDIEEYEGNAMRSLPDDEEAALYDSVRRQQAEGGLSDLGDARRQLMEGVMPGITGQGQPQPHGMDMLNGEAVGRPPADAVREGSPPPAGDGPPATDGADGREWLQRDEAAPPTPAPPAAQGPAPPPQPAAQQYSETEESRASTFTSTVQTATGELPGGQSPMAHPLRQLEAMHPEMNEAEAKKALMRLTEALAYPPGPEGRPSRKGGNAVAVQTALSSLMQSIDNDAAAA